MERQNSKGYFNFFLKLGLFKFFFKVRVRVNSILKVRVKKNFFKVRIGENFRKKIPRKNFPAKKITPKNSLSRLGL